MAIPRLASYPLPQPDGFPANKVAWIPAADRAVLLIHDMQRYFVEFYGDSSPLIDQVVANIAALRAWADAQGVPVVYTAQPTDQPPADRALLNDMWGPGLTQADPALQQVVDELAPKDGDVVLTKWRYSAFHRSNLQDLMTEWRRDQLIVCGVYAHIGCLTTCTDAFMRDIQAFLIGDAVADFSEEEHRMALRYVATRCGSTLSTAQVTGAGAAVFDEAWLRAQVQPLLDADDEAPALDDNLTDFGLDSVQVMTMVGEWQKRGLPVTFADLAAQPTLQGWLALLRARA
ncbi:isochorismatase family protein [Pseudomonas oryzihabitans]|uniref:isochorismatase family protein n=1 Tax=Pseudomonas oryzihabitans TaxID=47885 RepID=UPI00135D8938|nr:isochorismatase family protein [Pseudomonas oryzihabitans]MXS20087.1 isochorismatase family protein [Pseudomonas oryzihabitans]